MIVGFVNPGNGVAAWSTGSTITCMTALILCGTGGIIGATAERVVSCVSIFRIYGDHETDSGNRPWRAILPSDQTFPE
jgi:membrane-bound ClpP family serine protease